MELHRWATNPLKAGSQIGPYRVIAPVARGGMAMVYRAIHVVLGRTVAIKILPALVAADPAARARFQREARAVARLRHPHIVDLFDAGEIEGLPYLVTEFAAGGSLTAQVGIERSVAQRMALALITARAVGSALDYAHGHGVFHRDVKPGNILLTAEGTPILADFGLAQVREATMRLTQSGDFWGSPSYTSPEQAQGLPADGRSDLYSLGVVLFELLTGQVPFAAATPMAAALAHIHQPPAPACTIQPGLPPAIEPVLARALAKETAARWQSGAEVAAALATVVEAHGGAAVAPRWHLPAAGDGIPEATPSDELPHAAADESVTVTGLGRQALAPTVAGQERPANVALVPKPDRGRRQRVASVAASLWAPLAAACIALLALLAIAPPAGGPGSVTGGGQAAPAVTEASPPNGAMGVPVQPTLELRFSQTMDRDAVEAALAFQPPALVSFEWQDQGRRLLITPTEPLVPETTYVLRLGHGARDLQGQALAGAPLERRFVTRTPLAQIVRSEQYELGGFGGLARPLPIEIEARALATPPSAEVTSVDPSFPHPGLP